MHNTKDAEKEQQKNLDQRRPRRAAKQSQGTGHDQQLSRKVDRETCTTHNDTGTAGNPDTGN